MSESSDQNIPEGNAHEAHQEGIPSPAPEMGSEQSEADEIPIIRQDALRRDETLITPPMDPPLEMEKLTHTPNASEVSKPDSASNKAENKSDGEAEKGNDSSSSSSRKAERPTLFKRAKTLAWELTKIVIIVLLLRAYVIQASTVDGNSMNPTLHGIEGVDQDYLLVERYTSTFQTLPAGVRDRVPDGIAPEIKRGDIVVLASPENATNELVKRVVAIAGDYIFFYENELYVNGVKESELEYIPDGVATSHADGDIPEGDDDIRFYSEGDINDRIRERDNDEKEFKKALRFLGHEESFITKIMSDVGDKPYRRIGVRIPEDCVMVVGDNRGSGQSNDSRKWLEVRVNHSDDEKRLWATTPQIHGRVVARLKLPWDYDESHPMFPK